MGWFSEQIVDTGRLPLFLSFVAFVVTFLATRMITRMIRSGRGPFRDNVSDSGLHIHHAVPGVLLLSAGALIAVGANGTAGWAEFGAILVGVGMSLVLDEFALILRLDDVYWAEEGRLSVYIVAAAVAVVGLVLLGSNPVQVDTSDVPLFVGSLIAVAVHFTLVVVTLTKGKYVTALFGAFVPFVSLFGAIRLARPESGWAKRRYEGRKRERAHARAQRSDRRYGNLRRRAIDFVAGAPDALAGDEPAPVDVRTDPSIPSSADQVRSTRTSTSGDGDG